MAAGGAYVTVILLVCSLAAILLWTSFDPQISALQKRKMDSPSNVIVVGGGLAGLSATIEAVRHGAKVTIIEKEKNIGGNSAKATSGINAVGTKAQKDQGVEDSVAQFVKDTLASGDGLAKEDLVEVLAQNSNDAIEFLSSFAMGLTDVVQLGGHSARRTHRFPPSKDGKPIPVGFTIVSTLRKYVETELNSSVTIITNAAFKELTLTNEKVSGLRYTSSDGSEHVLEGTVVLSAGGYANDHTSNSLLDKYVPQLSKYPTTNGPWATGDVIKALGPVGVSLILMDKVQVHPTGFVDPKDPTFHTKFLAPEALRGCGAILLNADGKRFANELGRRDYLSDKIFSECDKFGGTGDNIPTVATMLLTQQVIDKFGPHLAGFYIFKGLISKVGTLDAAAEKIGVSVDTLKQTVAAYNKASETGKDEFGKQAFPATFSEDDTFYVSFVTPTLHYCMGGIEINAQAEVLGQFGGVSDASHHKPHSLPGIYAAGEVSGGVHGNNRLGGNSLLECVVFGRIAGHQAAHYRP